MHIQNMIPKVVTPRAILAGGCDIPRIWAAAQVLQHGYVHGGSLTVAMTLLRSPWYLITGIDNPTRPLKWQGAESNNLGLANLT